MAKGAPPDSKIMTTGVVAILDSFREWTNIYRLPKTYTRPLGNLQTFITSTWEKIILRWFSDNPGRVIPRRAPRG